MAVRYPMTVVECKRGLLKQAAAAPDKAKYKIYRKGTTAADRFIEVNGKTYNSSFEERKLYLFGVQQLVTAGYIEFVMATEEDSNIVEEFELTYGGILAVLDPSWDLTASVSDKQSFG
ncbi:MAG: hypothetical protein K2X81_28445 [Candidatus Obscuribacterales bacterium]|nr:hypothetical protein [Candidatus Obscuribacterales bacterium]